MDQSLTFREGLILYTEVMFLKLFELCPKKPQFISKKSLNVDFNYWH